MQHTNFQDHQPFGSKEDDFFRFLARLYKVQGELLKSPRLSASMSAFLSHCDQVLFRSFPKVHISTATHQKAFIFGP